MSAMYPTEFINFLKQPESYPHKPQKVEHIQTHISHVFIVSPYVYKFKKPVNFDFLDFSTLEKRKYYCDQEVKLNSRLCSGIYHGVIPVYKKGDSWTFDSTNQKEPVEYAVRMDQLSEEYFLHEYIKRGEFTTVHLDRVADKLVPFYENQSPDEDVLAWGRPDKIKINTDENFEQTQAFIGKTIRRFAYDAIRKYTARKLENGKELFEKRIREEKIIDGHGDLHLEHVHMTQENVCIYDCIEFNDRFRYQDIAADIGFLSMDLDFNDLQQESRYFAHQMAEKLDDPDLLHVIDFYKCYRAYIRGKVKSLESGEEEVSDENREKAAGVASRYFTLALKYALLGSRPAVLVFMGPIAGGKSTLAKNVARHLKINRYSSDIIRKNLAGLPLNERTPSSQRDRLYRKSMSERTYKQLFESAKNDISNGKNAILDATFGQPGNRNQFLSALKEVDADVYFIETTASKKIREARLQKRETQEETISDARAEDMELLDSRYTPPEELDSDHHVRIDTDQTIENSINELFDWFTRV